MKTEIRYYAEWELDGPILLALPHDESDWNYILPEAIDQYRRILTALEEGGEKIWLIVKDKVLAEKTLCDLQLDNTRFIEIETNDTWTRDYGPIIVERHERIRALDFGFNGWGLKFASNRDNLVNLHLTEKGFISKDSYRNRRDFILEGGSIETDGKGTLMTTSKCLLSPNRNGGKNKIEIGEVLTKELGVDHILWLDYGALLGDDTDSHIDTLCRFGRDNTILFTGCRDMDDPQFEELLKMRAQLTLFRNKIGEQYNLIELPLPDAIYDEEGQRLPATYANYLITPRAIYMPVYNQPQKDSLALQTIRIAFPEKKVIPVDCTTLIKQHGSLHCSTITLNH